MHFSQLQKFSPLWPVFCKRCSAVNAQSAFRDKKRAGQNVAIVLMEI